MFSNYRSDSSNGRPRFFIDVSGVSSGTFEKPESIKTHSVLEIFTSPRYRFGYTRIVV